MRRWIARFSIYESVVMALMAALGIAVKPIVVPLAHLICGPFVIPGGALAGGLYMMWLIIGYGLVKKPGTAVIIGLIQACLVIFTGVIGSHGIMSLLTYAAPGLAVEIVQILLRHHCCCAGCCAIGGMAANVAGSACVNVVFFRAPGLYLALVLSVSALSGLLGGLLAWKLLHFLDVHGVGPDKIGGSQWNDEV